MSQWPLCSQHLPGPADTGAACYFYFVSIKTVALGKKTKHSLTSIWADPKSICYHITQLQMTYQPGRLVVTALEIIVSNKEVAITQSLRLLLIPQPFRVTQHPSTLSLLLTPGQAWWSAHCTSNVTAIRDLPNHFHPWTHVSRNILAF